MGRSTQLKNAKKEMAEQTVMNSFACHNHKMKNKALEPVRPVGEILRNYGQWFVQPLDNFESRLKSKCEDKLLMEMVRFSFNRYPVNFVLSSVWTHGKLAPILKVDYHLWYICVAQGGSLYKSYAKEHLTKKEVHNLVTCPHLLNINQALCYTVAKSAGASEGLALKLCKSKLSETTFTEFWKSVNRFFVTNTPKDINEINDLMDYIRAKKVETDSYSMSGKTLAMLRKGMTDWHYELRRIKIMGNASWEGTYLPDEEFKSPDYENDKIMWTMHQIKTAKELAREGTQMHHCVYSYRDGCVSGRLSIWSLSRCDANGLSKPKITVELRNNGWIAQARGFGNRAMKPDERYILNLWVKRNNLSW
jgi:hypothetical protein